MDDDIVTYEVDTIVWDHLYLKVGIKDHERCLEK